MIQLRNLQWWTGALLVTLMCSIVLFAFVARKPLCIDSKLVERIDSVTNSGTSKAYRCALRRHVSYDETLAQKMPELSRRLQRLERFLDWLGPLQSRVNLTIIQGSSDHFRLQGQEIYLSESILNAQGQLEKAVLRVWFRERAHSDLLMSNLIEESITDFLYFAFNGEFDLQDAKTEIYLTQDLEPLWPRVLSKWSGYCHSLWRSNEDMKLCEDLNHFTDDEIHLMSLRPLITQSLIAGYENLKGPEQMAFLKAFADSLAQISFHEKNFGLTPTEPRRQSFFEATSMLENWQYFLRNLDGKVPSAEKFSAFFEMELKRRGFDQANQEVQLDNLVFAEEITEPQTQNLMNEIDQQKSSLIGLESHGTLQMGSKTEPLSLKLLSSVHANTGVYLHCGAPDLKKITELSKRVEKLLYVHLCNEQVVYLKGYFQKGVLSFARQNPGLRFAEFHLPSLMLALQKLQGQNPIQLLSEKKKDSLRPIGWKEPVYDEGLNAYHSQAAIEMVDWFRL